MRDKLLPASQSVRPTPGWLVPLVLIGILVVALGLRLWGITFGLPYLYHYDEHFYVNTALKTGTGALHYPPNTVPGLSNILLVQYGIYYLLGRVAGLFANAAEFESVFRSDPTVFYLLGRITNVVLATAAVGVTYLLASRTASRVSGVIAAAFLAVAFLDVRNAHYLAPDTGLAFFALLTVTLACLAVAKQRLPLVWLAAFTAGLTLTFKWTGLAVIAPVLIAGILLTQSSWRPNRRLLTTILLILVLFFFGFAILGPQVLMAPERYAGEISNQQAAGSSGGFELWQVDTVIGWVFYAKMLNYGLGLPLLLLAVAGLGLYFFRAIKYRDRVSLVLIAFPVLYYLVMGSTTHYFARYALPLIPFLTVFAAYTVTVVFAALAPHHAGWAWSVGSILVVAALAQPLIESVRHDMLLTRTDTRTLAKEWIEQNIPAGAKIAVEWRTHGPPLATAARSVPYAARVFDVTIFEQAGLSEHPLAWYVDQGFEYIVSTSFIADNPLVHPAKDQTRQAFYKQLAETHPLLISISPTNNSQPPSFVFDELYGPLISLWVRDRPGPIINIYQLPQ